RSATAAVHTRALRAHEEKYLLEIWTSVRSAPSRGVQALGSVVPASTAAPDRSPAAAVTTAPPPRRGRRAAAPHGPGDPCLDASRAARPSRAAGTRILHGGRRACRT